MAGWNVNQKRVQRIWRSEGLKVPKRQPKRGRLWLADGSCIRLRPEHRNHVWAYDFVAEKTHDGRTLKLLCVIDEYTHECLAIRVARRMTANDVLWVLADLFLEYGIPKHIRSDNGPEFVASAVRDWLADLGVATLFIEPGSPWENGYVEPFSQGEPGSMNSVVTPSSASQSRTALATNSGPLSERMCSGMPYSRKRSARIQSTSLAVIRRATEIARHSRVYSSTTVSRRSYARRGSSR